MTTPSDASSNVEQQKQLVARLTDKERECLERWLNHETAKEIGLSLGVSHHAVEKRLKSARSKLGVNSSIEAARILQLVEGYDQTVSQSAEVSSPHSNDQTNRSSILKVGALVMIMTFAAFAVILGTQSSSTADPDHQGVYFEADEVRLDPDGAVNLLAIVRMSAADTGVHAKSPDEMRAFIESDFRDLDQNRDGKIANDETPANIVVVANGTDVIVSGEEVWPAFLDRYDRDGDAVVSATEFLDASLAQYNAAGLLTVQSVSVREN